MDAERRRARFKACVARYLSSDIGKATPDNVARRLLQLDPSSIGMSMDPSDAQLHGLRGYLEASDLGAMQSEPPPPGEDDGDAH